MSNAMDYELDGILNSGDATPGANALDWMESNYERISAEAFALYTIATELLDITLLTPSRKGDESDG